MPLTGGEADKLGNSYEAIWTVRCMLRILAEEARSIYLEPFGAEGDGAEFIFTTKQGVREYHQVKRQRVGGWNIASLASAGVLRHLQGRLGAEQGARFVFVSQDEPSDLRELWERAGRVPDAEKFEKHYLNTAEHSGNFASLQRHWGNSSSEEAFALLCRLSIEGSAETTLRDEVLYRAGTLVVGEPRTVVSALWQLAFDSIRRTLDAPAIWAYLESPERGFSRRVWNNDPRLLQRIREANDRYLSPVRSLDILGRPIPRNEANQAFDLLQDASRKQSVLITGNAGAGKTGVVAEVMETAQRSGWLVLAFRLDRLDTTAQTARQVGTQLDLPDSPVTVLAGVAGNGPSLLVIDQLDAVSQTSGRHPAFFERVEELLRECSRHPHLRVVLACRQFDLQHDDRLRRLTDEKTGVAQPVPVAELDADTVRQVVQDSGVDPARLTQRQLAFLSTPLHLKLFTEIGGSLTFETLKDLYDSFWDKKLAALKARLNRSPQWIPLLDRMLARMVTEQSLSVPESLVEDDYPEDLAALLTETVLVRDGKRLSFFHETFFDYVFAKRFVAQGKRLLPFLLEQEQHLFLRGIVRQILTHERAEDFGQYLSDVRELLEHSGIRFHIKRLVFQWLQALSQPTMEEWHIVQALIASGDADIARWSASVINGFAWFNLLERCGWIERELESGVLERVLKAVNYLAWNVRDASDTVGKRLLTWVDRPDPWPDYAAQIFTRADVGKSRTLLDTYLQLRKKGHFSEVQPFNTSSTDFMFYGLPEEQPTWAIEVFVEWLTRFIQEQDKAGRTNPFKDKNKPFSHAVDILYDRMDLMVKNAPHMFVEEMLPIVLEIIRRNAHREGNTPWSDMVWPFHFKNDHSGLHEQLLEGVIQGLRHLVVHDPDGFSIHADTIRQYIDFETAGWLLARTYTADGMRFSEEAANFLMSSPEWLALGWTDSGCWASRELIESITPHCSDGAYLSLESHALNYYPAWERKHRSIGYSQLTLLNGFAPARRSAVLKRRLGELQRKFGCLDGSPAQGMRGGFVGPPFSARWEKMTDAQWLQAIRKYDSPEREAREPLRGGSHQLATVLEQRTESDPARFARLLLQMPVSSNPVYPSHILWGLKKAAKIEPGLVWDAARYCHALPHRPCGRALSSALQPYYDDDLPPDILEMVAWYATEDPDPKDELWLPAEGRTVYYGGDVSSAGLNSVRGGMAWSVAGLLFAHKEYFDVFAPILQRMVSDPSFAVRTQVASALLPVLNIDRNSAVALFLRLCESLPPALLGEHFIVEFLSYAHWTHFKEIQPLVEAMLASGNPKAEQCGAQIACLAAFTQPEAEPLFASCLIGSEKMRLGAAEAAAARLTVPKDQTRSETILIQLFDDENADIRRAAANCFREMEGDELSSHGNLIAAFLQSVAFQSESYAFFQALEKATVPLPDMICSVFEKSAALMREADGAETRRTGRFADREAHLLVRLYERTSDAAIKHRCLDTIDALARTEAAYDLEQTLATRDM